MVDTFDPSTLKLSDGAVKKIHSLSDPDKEQEINLRVYVTGAVVLDSNMASRLTIKLM